MAEETTELFPNDPELDLLRYNKQDGYNYRERRQKDWEENYTLSRDKVQVNRLLQRQSVNIPLMKTVIRTLLKDVDDLPVLYFENLDNDKEAEVFKNEYWKVVGERNKFEIIDIVDKRQVFHFGRSFDQWQIMDGFPKMTIVDPQDILVSRYTDPSNIHSSRFLIHTHIFVPLSVLEQNKSYDQEKIKNLKEWHATAQGIVKAKENEEMLIEKNKKMADMGVQDIDNPITGETYVEISLHFAFRKEEDDEEDQIYLYVEADGMCILQKEKLETIIGETSDHFWRTHYPYNSWADDVERQDFWSDGIADMVRTPNKVLNAWYSQLVETRSLRGMGMHYFNSNIEGFQPQSYEPKPFGWYGIPLQPGQKLSDVMQKVEIPDLTDSMDEINFVIGMVEKATGATSTQQGVQTENQATLGEVQLIQTEAKERVRGMSKFYTQVWKERGEMFVKLIEAASDKLDAVKIYKKGRQTDNIYSREISPDDWKSKFGYRCKVWNQAEKNEKDTQQLQKLGMVTQMIPGNVKLMEIQQRKALEYLGLDPDEINEVMEIEKQKQMAMMAGGMMGMNGLPIDGQAVKPGMTPLPMGQAPAPALPPGQVQRK